MSASMVRQSLAIVDADFGSRKETKKRGKGKNIGNLIPENHKLIKKVSRKGHTQKVQLLKTESKRTVSEVRKNYKSKEERLKENLKKLKLIQEACTVDLDEGVAEQLIERAITRRPVKPIKKSKKEQKTAFTEEDFANFETDYVDA